jgi:hypothetical protein
MLADATDLSFRLCPSLLGRRGTCNSAKLQTRDRKPQREVAKFIEFSSGTISRQTDVDWVEGRR